VRFLARWATIAFLVFYLVGAGVGVVVAALAAYLTGRVLWGR
jgi:hypothetical protein